MDESLLSLIIFIIFAGVSVVGKVMKSNPPKPPVRTGNTQPVRPPQPNKSSMLKDLLSTIEDELAGKKPVAQTSTRPVESRAEPLIQETVREVKPTVEVAQKSIAHKESLVLNKSDIRRAFVMKEILDNPVSLR